MELTATEVWSAITAAAREVLPDQTYRTWLTSTEAVALLDDTLVVGAPTKFAVEWIDDKYGRLLRELAANELGRPLELQFTLHATGERPGLEGAVAGEVAGVPNDVPETHAPGGAPQPSTDGLETGRRAAEPSSTGVSRGRSAASSLNERYTFDRFVIGTNNQLAAAACQRVADAPAQAYNPLFICGGVGLGKTHLMHAIGNGILSKWPDRAVAYVPSEQFTNEMITAIQSGRTPDFRRRYRQIDVLLVDDVHFLGNKEGTQEEFFHTFNSLHDAHRQIVITSDRPPQEIPGLQERLVSRFEWGLVTDINAPDFETRVAILQKKAAEDGLTLEEDVIAYIARSRKTSVRHLEGAMIKLLAVSSLQKREITLDLAREALGARDGAEEDARPTPEEIRLKTAETFGVKVEDLTSKRRTRNLTVPRQVAMYLIKMLLDLPYVEIGNLFGGRDHSTVIHSVNKVEADMAEDPVFRGRVRKVQEELVR